MQDAALTHGLTKALQLQEANAALLSFLLMRKLRHRELRSQVVLLRPEISLN